VVATLFLGCERDYGSGHDDRIADAGSDAADPNELDAATVPFVVVDYLLFVDPKGRGNDERGTPFGPTLCPNYEVVTGLVVELRNLLPAGVTLQCARLNANGSLAESHDGPRVGATPEIADDLQTLACPAGFAAVSLRGAEQPEDTAKNEPRTIATLGIECAELKSWLRGDGWPSVTMQAGNSGFGSENFVDGCTKRTGILKGLAGRISDRFEKVSVACVGVGPVL
jgi:hypothetical protein